jgi:uncharacterized metal-binding protein
LEGEGKDIPSGKVHSALTLSTASGVLAPHFIWMAGGNPFNYLAGCLIGIMVMPDMDVDRGNISDAYIRKVFPPAQWLWRILWTPYSVTVPHRHFISHFPIVGTLLRIGYIFLIVNILIWIIGLFSDTVSFVWFWDWSFVLGLCHVDAIHFLADKTIKGKEMFEDAYS